MLTAVMILACMLPHLTCPAAAAPEHKVSSEGLYAMTTSVRAGGEAEFLLVLPSREEDHVEWALYPARCGEALLQGPLDTSCTVRQRKLRVARAGVFTAVLVLRNDAGEPTTISTAQVKVLPSATAEVFGTISGPIIGALLAVVAFLLQDWVRLRNERRREQKTLSAKISRFLARLGNWDGNADTMPDLPGWMTDPNDPDWSPELQSGPFSRVVTQLQQAQRRAAAGTLQKSGLEDILLTLEDKLP